MHLSVLTCKLCTTSCSFGLTFLVYLSCMHRTQWSMLTQRQPLIHHSLVPDHHTKMQRQQMEARVLLAGQLLGTFALDYPIHCHGSQCTKRALQDPARECADCGAHVQQGKSLSCASVTVVCPGASSCSAKLQAVLTESLDCNALGGWKTLARYIRAAPSEWLVIAGADCLG